MKEQIEDYFNGTLSEDERKQFELELLSNAMLAEDVAFYLQAKQAAKAIAHDNLLQEKHQQWTMLSQKKDRSKRNQWIGIAASLLLIISIGFYFNWFQSNLSAEANAIVSNNLKNYPVHLGEEKSNLKEAIHLYNEQQYEESSLIAMNILKENPNDAEGLKILGLSQMQLKAYDEAINTFTQLDKQNELINNPAKYYMALAHLVRNQKDDELKGKELLEIVLKENLPGKQEAIKLLE
ncbi:hypothetical protein [Sphingobacterium endophyticum]|uniref:hypothetical protein n=1 Tax=Sphingobacterium endophyticum TaxID=2546448 RepID=UPI0012E2EFF9|nr:hypothetical protein [Sphingobacterium endophyticum]